MSEAFFQTKLGNMKFLSDKTWESYTLVKQNLEINFCQTKARVVKGEYKLIIKG